jgi:uncharacterized protein YraI
MSEALPSSLRWRVVHSPRVAIRSGPSTDSTIVGVVKTGAEVRVQCSQ